MEAQHLDLEEWLKRQELKLEDEAKKPFAINLEDSEQQQEDLKVSPKKGISFSVL